MKKEEFRKQWKKPQEEAFAELKAKLMSNPIMAHPNITKPFYIHCDGSYNGLGATLNQKGKDHKLHVVWYASRALSPAEKNYDAKTKTIGQSTIRFSLHLHGHAQEVAIMKRKYKNVYQFIHVLFRSYYTHCIDIAL